MQYLCIRFAAPSAFQDAPLAPSIINFVRVKLSTKLQIPLGDVPIPSDLDAAVTGLCIQRCGIIVSSLPHGGTPTKCTQFLSTDGLFLHPIRNPSGRRNKPLHEHAGSPLRHCQTALSPFEKHRDS
jgi:hypothetical protein